MNEVLEGDRWAYGSWVKFNDRYINREACAGGGRGKEQRQPAAVK